MDKQRSTPTRVAFSIVAGLIALVVTVVGYQVVVDIIMVARNPELVERMNTNDLPPPSMRYLLMATVMDAVGAGFGGWVCAFIARDLAHRCINILATILFIGCVATILGDVNRGLPLWVPLARAVLATGALLLVGRRMARRYESTD
jgi:hypothetical protein